VSCGAPESERLCRLVGGERGILTRRLPFAGGGVVGGERLEVARIGCLDAGSDAQVHRSQRLLVELPDHSVADAAVEDLDQVAGARPRGPHQVRRAKLGHGARMISPQLGGAARHALHGRLAGDGDHLQKPERILTQISGAGQDHHGQGGRSGIGDPFTRGHPSSQLVHEIGIAARLASDLLRRQIRHLGRSQERPGQLPGLAERESANGNLVGLCERTFSIAAGLEQDAQDVARIRFFAAVGHHQKQWRRRVLQQPGEERHAAHVAPLQIVDEKDQRAQLGNASEELAQRREGTPAKLHRIERGHGRTALRLGHRLDATQDRKRARQRLDIERHEWVGLLPGQTEQEPAERIDESIDGRVRDRLALVAPSGQHQRLVLVAQTLEEVLDERGLAHARAALDAHREPGTAARRLERLAKRGKLTVAADQ